MSDVPVGSIGGARLARLDAAGGLHPDGAKFELDWWVGADDRWHVARDEVAVRQRRVGAAPVYETAMRIPGGDAAQRVYGIGGPSDLVVVEVENQSPAPFVQAFVLRGDLRSMSVDGTVVRVGRRAVLVLPKPPARWAVSEREGGALEIARSGRAEEGPFAPTGRAREVAFLHPVAHRTRLRAGLVLGDGAGTAVDMSLAPAADDAARGWVAQLDRGMRVVLTDESLQQRIDAARADALLGAWGGPHDAALFNTLEDWGFDVEAARVWHGLGWRERRRVSRRVGHDTLLRRVRDALVRESIDEALEVVGTLDLVSVGQGIEVHDAPTRQGRVSYAVRWHGDRPALLWDCECPGVRLRSPALDATWSSDGQRGEVLLAAMDHVAVDAPE